MPQHVRFLEEAPVRATSLTPPCPPLRPAVQLAGLVEERAHVELRERALVRVAEVVAIRVGAVGRERHVHLVRRQVGDGDVEVPSARDGDHVADGVGRSEGPVKLLQLRHQDLAVAGAEPVHTVVHDVADGCVPRIVHRLQVRVSDEIRHGRAVLNAAEVRATYSLAISHTEDEVTGPVRVRDPLQRGVNGWVLAQDVAQED
eukprot:CAMPEP_0182534702 /NCGR_PEP_ID=MMETSP1323-20130603/16322_1 /TAXON_ID=236787 /ORGANISM="Florenciella parvula, Strain RCC1693" /LENGTH=201 /DNA_ID=CAMNT_0024744751 /DNA_START=182 /DNA_END=788 /DNA_ORIENTATION=-